MKTITKVGATQHEEQQSAPNQAAGRPQLRRRRRHAVRQLLGAERSEYLLLALHLERQRQGTEVQLLG